MLMGFMLLGYLSPVDLVKSRSHYSPYYWQIQMRTINKECLVKVYCV